MFVKKNSSLKIFVSVLLFLSSFFTISINSRNSTFVVMALDSSVIHSDKTYNNVPLEVPQGLNSKVLDLNSEGLIVGYISKISDYSHASVWENGQLKDLGTLGGKNSMAYAINSKGQIVGVAGQKDDISHAFVWTDNKMKDLGTFGGKSSTAFDINDNGLIIGSYYNNENTEFSFLLKNGEMTELGSFDGETLKAKSINESNQIMGEYVTKEGKVRGFIWQDGNLQVLGTLGGKSSDFTNPLSINDKGQIVGASSINGNTHAFLWEKGKMQDLGTLGGYNSYAQSINNNGEIVGSSNISKNSSQSVAFIWDKNKMKNLYDFKNYQNELNADYQDSTAYFINDNGEVLGTYTSANSKYTIPFSTNMFAWKNGKLTDFGLGGLSAMAPIKISKKGDIISNLTHRRTTSSTGQFYQTK